MLTYKFRLYPTKEQEDRFTAHINMCRWVYNCALEHRITAYNKAKKTITTFDQIKELSAIKKEFPFLATMHSKVLEGVIFRLQDAYNGFFNRIKKGEKKAGFPKFQGKHRYNSFNYLGAQGFKVVSDKLRISKIGDIKMNIHRAIEGELRECTITQKNDKWYVSLACFIELEKPIMTGEKVGVDLGISKVVTTSDGYFHESLTHVLQAERRLKYLQRMVSRRKKGSSRREKARKMLAKQHEKVANRRKDAIRKAVKKLVDHYDLIAIEDLKVKNMQKNHKLAKRISEQSWGKFRTYLEEKAEQLGKEVIPVDPKNTSQMCSNCGEIVKKSLSVRVHNCHHCGYVEDRDVNAAKNILMRALGETPELKEGQLELQLTEADSANRGWMDNSSPDESRNQHRV